jgi:hypothetical protein
MMYAGFSRCHGRLFPVFCGAWWMRRGEREWTRGGRWRVVELQAECGRPWGGPAVAGAWAVGSGGEQGACAASLAGMPGGSELGWRWLGAARVCWVPEARQGRSDAVSWWAVEAEAEVK